MIRIEFSEDEIERLRRERFEHPHPRIQRKMEALLLKSEDLPHHQMTRILGVSENTLRQYLREYRGASNGSKRFDFALHEVNWTSIANRWKPISRSIRPPR